MEEIYMISKTKHVFRHNMSLSSRFYQQPWVTGFLYLGKIKRLVSLLEMVTLPYSFAWLLRIFLGPFFFLMWTIFQVFIEFVTLLRLFYAWVLWPRGMWDLSYPTTNRRHSPCSGRWSLNHWITREIPENFFLNYFSYRVFGLSFKNYPFHRKTYIT